MSRQNCPLWRIMAAETGSCHHVIYHPGRINIPGSQRNLINYFGRSPVVVYEKSFGIVPGTVKFRRFTFLIALPSSPNRPAQLWGRSCQLFNEKLERAEICWKCLTANNLNRYKVSKVVIYAVKNIAKQNMSTHSITPLVLIKALNIQSSDSILCGTCRQCAQAIVRTNT